MMKQQAIWSPYDNNGGHNNPIMPFLDNLVKSPSPVLLPALDAAAVTPLSEFEAIDLVKTCFASAAVRDILYTLECSSAVSYLMGSIQEEYIVYWSCFGSFLASRTALTSSQGSNPEKVFLEIPPPPPCSSCVGNERLSD
ncbi:hypothetical protein DM860_004833 [Cuscuta australis]|uniref:Uncharacterized protein n=1 Tax=Cuscuta australis TaxID=267555 RepID=A0A328DLS8_9ASTE|nr:hypothetical protein DM860_004833 [Cuscuta australis]